MRGISGPWAATPGSSVPVSLHMPPWGSRAPQLQSVWWSLPCTMRPSTPTSGPKAQRPGHLPGLRLGAHGLLGSPERTATSSPVTTLTQTMHHLAGLGR